MFGLIYLSIITLLIIFTLKLKLNKMLKFVAMIFLIFIFFMFFDLYLYKPMLRSEILPWYESFPSKHIIVFIAMVIGMVSNYAFDFLKARINAKASDGKVKLPKFMWEELCLPIIISAPIYGIIWDKYGNEELALLTLLGSFQNGFFWKAVIEKIQK